jgi:transposase-like protein
MAFYFVSTFAIAQTPIKQPALRLSRTKNLHFAKATFPGFSAIDVQVPKIRDKSKQGIKFNSLLIPPYLKRTKSIEELLPVLYLKGISTGDFSEALKSLLGANAKGLSAGTISRLKWYLNWHRALKTAGINSEALSF